ncbi:MAG TPA: tetratricopeptide repeat protein, partial [Bacteroidetes bacterium]|nr:tetratricopeptide repeat protein [Bacteroidota bacterium]
MRQRNSLDRQAIFYLISQLEDMIDKGEVCFPDERQYHDLINYYEGEYLFERALEVAGYAIDQYCHSLDLYLRKAEILLQNRQAEQALATLDQADRLAPGGLASALLRAEALAALGLCTEALHLLESLRYHTSGKDLSKVYTQEGLLHHYQKNYEMEYLLLEAALKEDPSNDEALSRMWYCVEAARKHRESIELHKALLEQNPFSSLAWYNLGASHQYLANHDEAIEAYEYAFLTNPDFEFAYRSCAEVCMDIRDYRKALQCYQELMERCEPDDDLFLCIGQCYENLNNYPVARTFFNQALICNPLNDEALFHIGTTYAGQKKWKKALPCYLKAIVLNPRDERYFAAA